MEKLIVSDFNVEISVSAPYELISDLYSMMLSGFNPPEIQVIRIYIRRDRAKRP